MPPDASHTASSTPSTARRTCSFSAVLRICTGLPNMKSTIVWTRQPMSFSITTSRVSSSNGPARNRAGSPCAWPEVQRIFPAAVPAGLPNGPTGSAGSR